MGGRETALVRVKFKRLQISIGRNRFDQIIGRILQKHIIAEFVDGIFHHADLILQERSKAPLREQRIESGGKMGIWSPVRGSRPLHKTIHHPLLPRPVELDRQLVAVDRGDVAVAEFLVEDAVAERER